MKHSKISIYGFDLLGDVGSDGIRFVWKYKNNKQLLESAAFLQHRKGVSDNICGYTTSVSMGCILRAINCQCRFCRTGTMLPYSDALSAFDIAKQNIFMVLADINCSDHAEHKNFAREFAYMGQGEPGYSYPQVREAIKLTNYAMQQLGQKVHRHIISTAGVPEMISSYKDDVRSGYFEEKVTLHFSLHATSERCRIMPIDQKYPFNFVLDIMKDIVDLTGEKPCIGIMLFNEYTPMGSDFVYSNKLHEIKEILNFLDPMKFRVSFCEFNDSMDVGESKVYSIEDANEVLDYAVKAGFGAKLFSSFGKEKATACGMLGSKDPESKSSTKWLNIEKEVEILISDAYRNFSVAGIA